MFRMQVPEHSLALDDVSSWHRIKSAFERLVSDKAKHTRERLNCMRTEAERAVTVGGIVLEDASDEPKVPLERYVPHCAKPS